MLRRPPRSTRTDTLFSYTTLFRSPKNLGDALCQRQVAQRQLFAHEHRDGEIAGGLSLHDFSADGKAIDAVAPQQLIEGVRAVHEFTALAQAGRSEERRVGKECVSTCRYRWST